MSAGGIVADTMANLKTVKDASGKEYTYKQPTMNRELMLKGIRKLHQKAIDMAKAGKPSSEVYRYHYEKVRPKLNFWGGEYGYSGEVEEIYTEMKEELQDEVEKNAKESLASYLKNFKNNPNIYKIPFDADYQGLLGFASVILHKGSKLIGSPNALPKGLKEKLARLTIKMLFAPNPLYNNVGIKPVKSIDPLILSCFTNPLQVDGGVFIEMKGNKVTGHLIYDEITNFNDAEYLKEKTIEAAKSLNLY
jgi:hypothetical protein